MVDMNKDTQYTRPYESWNTTNRYDRRNDISFNKPRGVKFLSAKFLAQFRD
jgi:hypothetical protein